MATDLEPNVLAEQPGSVHRSTTDASCRCSGGVALAGVVAMLWCVSALGGRFGPRGMLDQLADADRSLSGAEWWAPPVIDIALLISIACGMAHAAWRSRSGWGAAVSRGGQAIGWIGIFTALVTVGSASLMAVGVTGGRSLGGWGVAIAVAAALAVVRAEPCLVSRTRHDGVFVRAVIAGTGVLTLGSTGIGFVPVAVARLTIEAVRISAAADDAHPERDEDGRSCCEPS